MSAGKQKILQDTTTIAANGTTFSESFDAQCTASEIILSVKISNRTDGTYTVTLQESPDGSTWIDVSGGATASLIADGTVLVKPTVSILNNLRVKIVAASVTTGADVKAVLHFSNRGK